MANHQVVPRKSNRPSRRSALVFGFKAALLRLNRSARNLFDSEHRRYAKSEALDGAKIVAQSSTKLWTESDPAERHLQAGKAHNLRLAIRHLDGVEVPAGAVFSFWAQVGRATRLRGYVRGRELREGCIIPNVGGGLCQLSNALYDAALAAGFEIVERHAHTEVVPGSLAEKGRDATVFWNYVDLRWRAAHAFRIEASMTRDSLTIRFRSDPQNAVSPVLTRLTRTPSNGQNVAGAPTLSGRFAPNSCMSCEVSECFRHVEPKVDGASFGRAAFLVDEYWPEFDAFVGAQKSGEDVLCLPLDGRRFGKSNYAWDTGGFGRVSERRLATARRAYESRRLARQGAARQSALLRHQRQLAAGYASSLKYDVTHVTVMQGLLPFLWREGALGGRTFDVLMTALPLAALHERLDAAHALHPDSPTLSDFRADEWLVRAESEALENARRIITPHADVAALFGDRAMLLDWHVPMGKRAPVRGSKIVFAASTVGRKGAYEMREAARRLKFPLVVAGAELEGAGFWRGVAVESGRREDWLENARVVVLPAFVEHRPRRLLEAVGRGVPVVASSACGLEKVCGVTTVPAGDVDALCDAIEKILEGEFAPDAVVPNEERRGEHVGSSRL